MSIKILFAAAALGAMAMPAMAQTTTETSTVPGSPTTTGTPLQTYPGYDKTTPRTQAVNAVEGPVTDRLNTVSAEGAQIMNTTMAVDKQLYEADRQAYWAALVRHDARVKQSDARWQRQQAAYADAMAAWRFQVAECKRGNRKVCDMPTPTPEQFY